MICHDLQLFPLYLLDWSCSYSMFMEILLHFCFLSETSQPNQDLTLLRHSTAEFTLVFEIESSAPVSTAGFEKPYTDIEFVPLLSFGPQLGQKV